MTDTRRSRLSPKNFSRQETTTHMTRDRLRSNSEFSSTATAVIVFIVTLTTDVIVCGPRFFRFAEAAGDPAADAGLCRVYSYNVERRRVATMSSSTGSIFMTSSLTGVSSEDIGLVWNSRRYFICCHEDGAETACRDRTYQQPSDVMSEFCRGEVTVPGESKDPRGGGGGVGDRDSVRHWTQDDTELFTDGDLIYCGGCCGQHIASDACDSIFYADVNREAAGFCDRWVSCFIEQCRKVTADVIANRPLRCSVPPPPFPKHFIHERPFLPFNLTATLQAQLHHQRSSAPPSTTTAATSALPVHAIANKPDWRLTIPISGKSPAPSKAALSRSSGSPVRRNSGAATGDVINDQQVLIERRDEYCTIDNCNRLSVADRCRIACCAVLFCCDAQSFDRWQQSLFEYNDFDLKWPISAESLIIASIVFTFIAIISGLLLALHPKLRRGRLRRRYGGSHNSTSCSTETENGAILASSSTRTFTGSMQRDGNMTCSGAITRGNIHHHRVKGRKQSGGSNNRREKLGGLYADTKVLVITEEDEDDHEHCDELDHATASAAAAAAAAADDEDADDGQDRDSDVDMV